MTHAALINTLSKLVAPVSVVTSIAENGCYRGMTCSSFSFISLKPKIVSFSVRRQSSFHQAVLFSQKFAINVLADDQESVARNFTYLAPKQGSSPIKETLASNLLIPNGVLNSFTSVEHKIDASTRLPILSNTLMTFICKSHSCIEVGDHYVWYGDVLDFHSENDHALVSKGPLLYGGRRYLNLKKQ